jgi:hypothetical protein
MGYFWVFQEEYNKHFNAIRQEKDYRANRFAEMLKFLVSSFESKRISLPDFKVGMARIRAVITAEDKSQEYYAALSTVIDFASSYSLKLQYGSQDVETVNRGEAVDLLSRLVNEFEEAYYAQPLPTYSKTPLGL